MKQQLAGLTARIFFVGVFVQCMFYALYKYTFSFNYQQLSEGGHYLAMPVVTGAVALLLAVTIWNRKNFECTMPDVLIFMTLAGSMLIVLVEFPRYNLHHEAYCNAICFLSLYVLIRIMGNEIIQQVIFPILLMFFLLELCYGYVTFFRSFHAGNLPLLIKGHLENSGLYSIYLVIHLPLFNYYLTCFIKNKKVKVAVLFVLYVAIGVLVLAAQSRAAMIGMVCYPGKLCLDDERLRRHRKVIILVSLPLLLLLVFGLFYLKPDSAFGRYIIWKISSQHWREFIWTGIGYGQFPVLYPRWQIAYFDALPIGKVAESLSADEIYVAYNEPLQLLIELGPAGFALVALFFVRLVFKQDQGTGSLSGYLRNVLILLFITSLFSYPLHVNVILILLGVCLAYLVPETFRKFSFIGQHWMHIITLTLMLSVMVRSIMMYRDVIRWNRLQQDVFLQEQERLVLYRELYPAMKGNSHFILDYGMLLLSLEDKLSVKILEESKSQLITTSTMMALAAAYESNGEVDKAISTWTDISNFVPYKFSYRDKLLDLRVDKKDNIKALETARWIVAMPVKKDDETVRNIKKKAQRLLNASASGLSW